MSLIAGVRVLVSNHGPTIMTVAGVTGVVGAGVLACKATIKVQDIKLDTVAKVEAIKESGYTDEAEYNAAIRKEYFAAGRAFARAYGPAIIIGALSIGSILYGHRVLCGRNLVLAGAYKALTCNFDDYRARVKERFGEDVARSVTHDMRTDTIHIWDKDGERDEIVEYVPETMAGNPTSDRSVFFDDMSIYWSENPEENKEFLLKLQKRAQEKFDKDGYLFLNWIYKRLDVPENYAGANCGWVKGLGDNEIDFGIYDIYSAASRRFVNGLEPVILLNFNDDGYIADKI